MKAHTISDAFRACIGEREVTSAFFTTYSFEPDFFELEVIPLLLGDQALSSQSDIRSVQLQALMQDKGRRFAVVHDVDVFNPTAGSRLEVDYLPVRIGGGVSTRQDGNVGFAGKGRSDTDDSVGGRVIQPDQGGVVGQHRGWTFCRAASDSCACQYS